LTSTTIKTGNIARIKKIPSRSFRSHGHMPPAKTKILAPPTAITIYTKGW